MKMIRSTRQTSTSGVTLMSDVSGDLVNLLSELPDRCFCFITGPRGFLQEVDRHLRAGVRQRDREAIDGVLEVVISPDRRDGDEKTAGSGEERFGDTSRNRGDTAARLGNGDLLPEGSRGGQ